MLIPASIPVTVEKNRPNIEKKLSPGRKEGPELLCRLNSWYPVTPWAVNRKESYSVCMKIRVFGLG